MGIQNGSIRIFWNGKLIIVSIFLIGLVLSNYPPLVLLVGQTRIMRPDWALSLPLIWFFLIYRRQYILYYPARLAALFVVVAGLSVATTQILSFFDSVTVLLQLLFAVFLFIMLSDLSLTTGEFRTILRVWCLLTTVIAVYSIYQTLALNLGLPFETLFPGYGPQSAARFSFSRPAAVFSEPSFLASTLLLGVATVGPCVAADRPVLFTKRVQHFCLITLLMAVILSGSMSGYLTLGLAAVLGIFQTLRPLFTRSIMAIIGGGIVAGVVSKLFEVNLLRLLFARLEILSRIFLSGEIGSTGSINVRIARYLGGLMAWRSQPFLGIGIGQYDAWVTVSGINDTLPVLKGVGSHHGAYIQVIAGAGIVGLFVFLLLWLSVLREQMAALRKTTGTVNLLVLVAISVTVVNLINWLFTFQVHHTLRWGLTGLVYGFVAQQINTGEIDDSRFGI